MNQINIKRDAGDRPIGSGKVYGGSNERSHDVSVAGLSKVNSQSIQEPSKQNNDELLKSNFGTIIPFKSMTDIENVEAGNKVDLELSD